MHIEPRPGAVLYAKDLAALARFYTHAVGLRPVVESGEFVVLEAEAQQLVIVQAPPEVADGIAISAPPQLREGTPIKLVFLADIAAVRAAAPHHGGAMKDSPSEWRFGRARVCDGHDPEGNVFQVRQPLAWGGGRG